MWKNSDLQQRHAFTFTYPQRTVYIANKEVDVYQANPNHIKNLLALEREVYGETPWEKSAFLHEFTSSLPHLYLCVFSNEQLIGFSGVRVFRQDGHITNIIVSPSYQDSGIGTLMMQELERFSRQQTCVSMSLEVRKSNLDAQRFYRKLQFKTTLVKPNYYEREDALEMRKWL